MFANLYHSASFMPPKIRGPGFGLSLLDAKGAEIGRSSGQAVLSDTSVLTWNLWSRLGSGFLSQLGFWPGCGSLFPCPRQDPGEGTLWPNSSPSSQLSTWLPFSSGARTIYPMPASRSILKKGGGWEFLHLIWTWPKPAGLSMLPLIEQKTTAGECQEFIFLLIFAMTSTSCYKYWQVLKIISHIPAFTPPCSSSHNPSPEGQGHHHSLTAKG